MGFLFWFFQNLILDTVVITFSIILIIKIPIARLGISNDSPPLLRS